MQFGDATINEAMQRAESVDEFRGAALYDHPLTGAMATAMAIFLLLGMQAGSFLKAGIFTILMIGLLSFGGRTSMGISVIMLIGIGVVMLLHGLVTRKLSGGFLAALLAGLFLMPLLLLAVTAATTLGDRILTHLYVDDSITTRNIQWLVLDYLNTRDVLFGVDMARLGVLKYQIGLSEATTDIESPWLLMFLNLGVIGFFVYLAALLLFLVHLGRTANTPIGWVLLLVSMVIISSSNSLGRKTCDLVLLASCMISLGAHRVSVPLVLSHSAGRSAAGAGPPENNPSGNIPPANNPFGNGPFGKSYDDVSGHGNARGFAHLLASRPAAGAFAGMKS
jgi:hypothetical protein